MNFNRRKFSISCGLAYLGAFVPKAWAQSEADSYPNKPIRLLCPFAPAGGVDITARTIAQKLTEAWGQPVIVENRPGANGTIAVEIAARSQPDGYTLTMISYAKSSGRPLTYGSSGIGGFSHLAGGLFGLLTNTNVMHVPYKGGSLAMNDVISGQIDMLFSTILQSHGHIESGRLNPIAVTTLQRSPSLPQVPTMQEAGVKGYEVAGWYGITAPAGVPPAIINKLNKEIVKILKTPAMAERLSTDGSIAVGSTPQEFSQFIRSEVSKWRKVIKELKIQA